METKSKKSFTIVEVVVASLLLTVAMVPILRALTASHILDRTIEYRTRSLVLAQAKLEEIRAESIYNYDIDYSEESAMIEGEYLVSVIDADLTPPDNDLRGFTIFVGYDRNRNDVLEDDEIEVSLKSLIARRW
jgi:Tfp pilus assembly protein PilV